ncbi:MAG: hypothetical protein JWM43_2335 [Acidobacteriaceae bacterium]|nr:hypothetical protein [Acidobacteriaceae bacterium]
MLFSNSKANQEDERLHRNESINLKRFAQRKNSKYRDDCKQSRST